MFEKARNVEAQNPITITRNIANSAKEIPKTVHLKK